MGHAYQYIVSCAACRMRRPPCAAARSGQPLSLGVSPLHAHTLQLCTGTAALVPSCTLYGRWSLALISLGIESRSGLVRGSDPRGTPRDSPERSLDERVSVCAVWSCGVWRKLENFNYFENTISLARLSSGVRVTDSRPSSARLHMHTVLMHIAHGSERAVDRGTRLTRSSLLSRLWGRARRSGQRARRETLPISRTSGGRSPPRAPCARLPPNDCREPRFAGGRPEP